jgi:antitoxin component YwqK of YwqJK toxin-antitoxin module
MENLREHNIDGMKMEIEVSYANGNKEGTQFKFYPNGKMKSENNYKNGKLNGTQTEWNEDGKKKSEENI